MHTSSSEVSLPVSIVSGGSQKAKLNGVTRTETFSAEYEGYLPNTVLRELGIIYKNADNLSLTTIDWTNEAIFLLCKYMVRNNIDSLSAIQSGELGKLRNFFKQETRGKSTWGPVFNKLKRFSGGTELDNLLWPKALKGTYDKKGKTPGHSMHAYAEMGNALRKEIDRIREKKGRLTAAKENGRVITPENLGFIYKSTNKRFCKDTKGNLLQITRDDLICTILHYLPGWPVVNRPSDTVTGRAGLCVYNGHQGVRLGSANNEQAALELATQHGKGAIVTTASIDAMNPAELLLWAYSAPGKINPTATHHLRSLFNNTMEIIGFYYPTTYDWQCVYLYWVWLTGWNVETIASVAASDLGLGIDIVKHSPLEAVTKDHVEITGKAPVSQSSTKKNKMNDAGHVITGYKVRSQPKDEPKPYTHISDKNDPYSLYCVLKDFYEITAPLRTHLRGVEKDCILAGVARSRATESLNRCLSMFGGPLHGRGADYTKAGLGMFFENNPIYENEGEFKDSGDPTAGKPSTSSESLVRLWRTNAQMMRTTWETWQKKCGASLTERMCSLGHRSMRTTTTSYGAERVSVGMRRRELRHMLDKIEGMVLHGQLQRYDHRDSATKKNNIIQVFSHRQNDIFICQNANEPTWPGHKEYVDGVCTHFDECLFCKQCTITHDSLPVLVRWHRDIKNMGKLVGPIGLSDKVCLLKQAIEEVFNLCRNGGAEWMAAMEKAYELERNPEFTAPHFMYRHSA